MFSSHECISPFHLMTMILHLRSKLGFLREMHRCKCHAHLQPHRETGARPTEKGNFCLFKKGKTFTIHLISIPALPCCHGSNNLWVCPHIKNVLWCSSSSVCLTLLSKKSGWIYFYGFFDWGSQSVGVFVEFLLWFHLYGAVGKPARMPVQGRALLWLCCKRWQSWAEATVDDDFTASDCL